MEYNYSTNELINHHSELKIGDVVRLSGTVYTARDAAHKKLCEAVQSGEPLPFPLKNAFIYYAGPTPARKGKIIGSCGPTTSGRMDVYSPMLLDCGVFCMIGKGKRNKSVVDSIVKNGALYLCAIGGAGALASASISSCNVIAYPELGCESVKELVFNDFPLIVAINSKGDNIFD